MGRGTKSKKGQELVQQPLLNRPQPARKGLGQGPAPRKPPDKPVEPKVAKPTVPAESSTHQPASNNVNKKVAVAFVDEPRVTRSAKRSGATPPAKPALGQPSQPPDKPASYAGALQVAPPKPPPPTKPTPTPAKPGVSIKQPQPQQKKQPPNPSTPLAKVRSVNSPSGPDSPSSPEMESLFSRVAALEHQVHGSTFLAPGDSSHQDRVVDSRASSSSESPASHCHSCGSPLLPNQQPSVGCPSVSPPALVSPKSKSKKIKEPEVKQPTKDEAKKKKKKKQHKKPKQPNQPQSQPATDAAAAAPTATKPVAVAHSQSAKSGPKPKMSAAEKARMCGIRHRGKPCEVMLDTPEIAAKHVGETHNRASLASLKRHGLAKCPACKGRGQFYVLAKQKEHDQYHANISRQAEANAQQRKQHQVQVRFATRASIQGVAPGNIFTNKSDKPPKPRRTNKHAKPNAAELAHNKKVSPFVTSLLEIDAAVADIEAKFRDGDQAVESAIWAEFDAISIDQFCFPYRRAQLSPFFSVKSKAVLGATLAGLFAKYHHIWSLPLQPGQESAGVWLERERVFKTLAGFLQVLSTRRFSKQLYELCNEVEQQPLLLIKRIIQTMKLFEKETQEQSANPRPQVDIARSVAGHIASGRLNKAVSALTNSLPPATLTEEVLAKLHPLLNVPGDEEVDQEHIKNLLSSTQISFEKVVSEITVDEVAGAIGRLNKSGGYGGFCFSPELAVMCSETKPKLPSEFTRFLKHWALGHIPDSAKKLVHGGSLIAIPKDETGSSFRPIVPSSIFSKIIELIFLKKLGNMTDLFGEHQSGCKTPNGLSNIVFSANLLMAENPESTLVCCDITNAFGSVRINKLLDILAANDQCAFLVPFVASTSLGERKYLARGGPGLVAVPATSGVPQGSCLSPFLYSMYTIDVLRQCNAAFQQRNVFCTAYLDDICVFSRDGPGPAQDCLEFLHDKLAPLGQIFNPRKFVAVSGKCWQQPDGLGLAAAPSTIRFLDTQIVVRDGPEDGVQLLGVPVGSNAFIINTLEQCKQQLMEDLAKMDQHVKSVQEKFILLTHCFDVRTQFLLRHILPRPELQPAVQRLDDVIHGAMVRLVMGDNVLAWPVGTQCSNVVSLPIKRGGLGLQLLRDTKLPAFLAGVGAFFNGGLTLNNIVRQRLLVDGQADVLLVQHALDQYLASLGGNAVPADVPRSPVALVEFCRATKNAQHALVAHVHERRMQAVDSAHRSLADVDRVAGRTQLANSLSHRQWGSDVLLKLLPANDQLQVSDTAFRVALGMRLGVSTPAVFGDPPLMRACGATDVANNHPLSVFHAISCNNGKGNDTLTARHNRLRDGICSFLTAAGAACISEPTVIVTELNTRADIGIRLDDLRLVVDVTFRSPYVEADLARTFETPLSACIKAETDKGDRYREMYEHNNNKYLTVAMEVSGAYGKETTEFFKHVRVFLQNSYRNQHFPKSYKCRTYLQYFQQLIAVTLAEENARVAQHCLTCAQNRAQLVANLAPASISSSDNDDDDEESTTTSYSTSSTTTTASEEATSDSDDEFL